MFPSYQGEEQEVQLYYKMFSSTRHGFLGASVVSQPLSHVWAAVSDPTLWPLYHKPIQTARLHQRVTNSINLGEPGEGFPWAVARDRGSRAGGSPLGRPDAQTNFGSLRLQNDGILGVLLGWEVCPHTS